MNDARIDVRAANLAAVRQRWPAAFDLDGMRPLKIGIHLEVQAALGLNDQAART